MNNCKFCGKKTSLIYCSNKCQGDMRWANSKAEIYALGYVSSGNPIKKAKRFIEEVYGHRCALCGCVDWIGKPIVFVLDHVNGNPDDWVLSNLRLLCPNCDSQTPTFKGRNRGHGRHARRERYASGQSY